MLRASVELAPKPSEGFLIVDDLLRVRALSERAERLLALHETKAIERRVDELLAPADVSADVAGLNTAVVHAMGAGHDGGGGSVWIAVRRLGGHGVFHASVGPCQPGPAVLLVLHELA